MSRTILRVPASEYVIVEPVEAGKNDPPMQDWLGLDVGKRGRCPYCRSTHFGAVNPSGYFLVYRCHRCDGRYRSKVTPQMIRDVVGALLGEPRRYAHRPTEQTDPTGDPSGEEK